MKTTCYTDARLLFHWDGNRKSRDQNPLRNNLLGAGREGNARDHSICHSCPPTFGAQRANIFHVATMMTLLKKICSFPNSTWYTGNISSILQYYCDISTISCAIRVVSSVTYCYLFIPTFFLPFIKEYSFSPKFFKIILLANISWITNNKSQIILKLNIQSPQISRIFRKCVDPSLFYQMTHLE